MRYYDLTRDNDYLCNFNHTQWTLYLETIKLAGWEPKGTIMYSDWHPEMVEFGCEKNKLSHYRADDSYPLWTPEQLAKQESNYSSQSYEELLQSYRNQWKANRIEFRIYQNLNWSGSYFSRSTVYVTEADAIGMSKALQKIADYLETHRSVIFPDDSPCGKTRVARSRYHLEYSVREDWSYFSRPSRITLKAAPAFHKFADWASKGEFKLITTFDGR